MEFEVNGSLFAAEATEADIDEGLKALKGDGDSFAILSQDEMTYLQTSGWPEEGFSLEYQDGSLLEHFRCADENLPLESVSHIFKLYLSGQGDHRTSCSWERFDLPSPSDAAITSTIGTIAMIVLVAAALFWLFLK